MNATLIDRLESAAEGSRELDALVAVAAGWRGPFDHEFADGVETWTEACEDGGVELWSRGPGWSMNARQRKWAAPRFTVSVDDALALVPEGCDWSLTNWTTEGIDCYPLSRARVFPREQGFDFKWARAATPALALCVAILRAKDTP